jgi:DNA helicase II / ATP-dependent DNA helicase PcrA
MTVQSIPILDGEALQAVRHRGSHMQIIACAGSGKTEVVAQRVADLLADGADARSIIAFTFTERAAEELKARISARVEQRLGTTVLDKLGAAFVGTIHAYCFRFLQQYVPEYETYDVLDERRLTAFLCRQERALNLRSLNGAQFRSIKSFLSNVDVVENELLPLESLEDPFGEMVAKFYELLDQFRLLTYGQLIARAVDELSKPDVRRAVQVTLRYLIVDEYQDVNPAQEKLISLLTEGGQTELCVVGDDDQSIYQWRGSDVRNIVEFDKRYPDVQKFQISANRRSLPSIVTAAATFARSIPGRLEKEMRPVREPARKEIVTWSAETEADECDLIAQTIQRLHDEGLAYRDIAVLVRGRVAYGALLEAFDSHEVPVQPGGRTGLFTRPEAQLFGQTYAWLVNYGWSYSGYGERPIPTDDEIFTGYINTYDLDPERAAVVRAHLITLKATVPSEERPVNLVGDFYELLADLGVPDWDANDPMTGARLGTLARCSAILADYESVRRRSRPDPDDPGAQRGGTDRGPWYYANLATYIINYAQGAYEDFDGEPDVQVDAVDLTTVHKAKGLEWRVVFVPSLTKRRFPSSMTGRQRKDWLVPLHLFNRVRYEGSDADERRLFYVAMTRARDWLSLSRYERTAAQRATASPYHEAIKGFEATRPLPLPSIERIVREETEEPLTLTFSELAAYRSCGFAYRLRSMFGFQPFLAPELGYGKAVHHVMRAIAEHTRTYGHPPDAAELDRLFDAGFFLPAASKPAHDQLKRAAKRLVNRYLATYQDDLYRVWETERPFELHLPTAIINGRADVILDSEGGEVTALAIVDYKTSVDSADLADGDAEYALQLAVYADAGRREGLNVRAAYVHDLKDAVREPVDVTPTAIVAAEAQVESAVQGLRNREFRARPGMPLGSQLKIQDRPR